MGRKRIPGLYLRRSTWHIDKTIFGRRVYENTETTSLEEAEKYLARLIEQHREAHVYGVRPSRKFSEAALRYINENMDKSSIEDNILHLKLLNNYIGNLNLEQVHGGTLKPFIEARIREGKKPRRLIWL